MEQAAMHFTGRMSSAAAMQPAWHTGAALLVAAVVGSLLMQLAVHGLLPAKLRQDHTALGSAIFAVIGTTYAVLLAFVAASAWDRYSAAERLARHEANAVANIALISRGLGETDGAAIRKRARTYLTGIVDDEWPAMVAGHPVAPSNPQLGALQQAVMAVTPTNGREAAMLGPLVAAAAEVAADRRDRRLTADGTVPEPIWIALFGGGALMIAFSAMLGGPSGALHLLMTAVLAASGILIVLLIIGLASPFRGGVAIGADAYRQVLRSLDQSG